MAIDILILIILILIILKNYRIGFLNNLYRIFSFILSIFLIKILNPYTKEILANITKNRLKLNLDLTTLDKLENIQTLDTLPNFIKNFILKDETFNTSYSINIENVETLLENFLTNTIINIISFILTFIIVFIILRVVFHIFNFTVKLPILKGINKFLGAIWGILEFLILIWITLTIVMLITLNPNYKFIETFINNTTITKFLYDNNLLLIFILKYFNKLI